MFVYISIATICWILLKSVLCAITNPDKRDRFFVNIINWILLTIPSTYFYYYDYYQSQYISIIITNAFLHIVTWNIFLEIYFYFVHRYFHENKFLYTYIHKIHHTGIPNSILDVQYAHPLETILVTIPSFWGWPIFLDLIGFKMNLYALIIMYIVSTYNNINNHIEDNFHMSHHKKWNCNYGTTSILDRFMNTYTA